MKSKTKGGLCLKALIILTIAIIVILLLAPTVVLSVQDKTVITSLSATSTKNEAIKPLEAMSNPVSVPLNKIEIIPQVLKDISWCESRNIQSKIGYNYRNKTITDASGATSSVRYIWSRDIGLYQVNEYYHAKTAKALGIDIYTAEGNTKYALLLYNKNGTRDWNASKPCWSDIEAWKSKKKSYY